MSVIRRRPGKPSVKAECPSCQGTRALEYRWNDAGDVVQLKCRGCAQVFPAALTRAQIQQPFPPGTRRRRGRRTR